MKHGLMIVVDFTKLSESKSRLFRKKRLKLEKRTKLESIKKGVYFIPFENLEKPSENEGELSGKILRLILRFHAKANYFKVTQVHPPNGIGAIGNPFLLGTLKYDSKTERVRSANWWETYDFSLDLIRRLDKTGLTNEVLEMVEEKEREERKRK
ncbi:MAG: hypothetical protein ACFE7R_08785 [Candidatus Hodarchaeota archaeon]